MENNKYISMFKDKIAAEVKQHGQNNQVTPAYFEQLYLDNKQQISDFAKNFLYLPAVDEETLRSYYDVAKREYQSLNPIDMDEASTLTKPGFVSWLTDARAEKTQWHYTNRYLTLLGQQGRAAPVVAETKLTSLEIMGKLGDPLADKKFYVKGLVVGAVQSGKTGNFNAVINRAIDSGYQLVIVLSGIMEDLRSQTQVRIENDVIGEGRDADTAKGGRRTGAKGVGNIQRFGILGDKGVAQVDVITSVKSDFKLSLLEADFSLNSPKVLVCKKNVSILRNLIVWLHDYLGKDKAKLDIPLLILDDEADNASLNNEGAKGREYASKINGHIRALLQLFHKKSYLGYTATPFANVLQDRNDVPKGEWELKYKVNGEKEEKKLPQVDNIFPDDFIVLLSPPTNYIGAKQIFETITPIENKALEKLPLTYVVNDHIESFPTRVREQADGSFVGIENLMLKTAWEEKVAESGSYLGFIKHKEYKDGTSASRAEHDFPPCLPVSIKDAVLCFVLAIAVRESRRPKMINSVLLQPHNTMLIHVSRFTRWQNKTSMLVKAYVKELTVAINNDKPTAIDSIYTTLKNTWHTHYAAIVEQVNDYLPQGYVDEFMGPIVFESLKSNLPEAIKGLEVKAINSVTKEKLEYPNSRPQKVIAIGGNRLSRGFTLEGLTINYFVRSTNYSDTLLQMGRWFGYRPGYLDCCKVFTTQDSIDKFDSTTRCIEELEAEFKTMSENKKSPRSFELRVRKHPGALKITRPTILKNTYDVKWSYQDQLVMTTEFDVSRTKIIEVWETFKNDIAPKFKSNKVMRGGLLTYDATGQDVISLLNKNNNFDSTINKTMIRFIRECLKNDQLTHWKVAIKTTGTATKVAGKGELQPDESNLPIPIKLAIRKGPSKTKSNAGMRDKFLVAKRFKATGKSANIMSAGKDMGIWLEEPAIKAVERVFETTQRYKKLRTNKELTEEQAIIKAARVTKPEKIYRERMTEQQGVLIIYLFDSYYSFNNCKDAKDIDTDFVKFVEKEKYDLNIPLVGYAIGFPALEDDPGGEYVRGDYDLEVDELSEEVDPNDKVESLGDDGLPDDKNEV